MLIFLNNRFEIKVWPNTNLYIPIFSIFLKRFISEGLSEHGNTADGLALTQNNIRHQRELLSTTESSSLL